MHDLSDDQLLTLAQDGEEAAFAELMSRNSSSSFKLALSILKDRQDAEDEVQNSYWNAWRYLGRFQRDSKFSTWISRIVINQCLMRLRKARKASFLYLDEGADEGNVGVMELPDRGPTPEAELGRREMSAILHREVRRMPPILRSVLVLRDLDELPMDEVAVRLGITLVAAKSRLMRARAELRQRLERQFGSSERTIVPA
ncbi:MAG TPA: sigma-70 family RNA polymerase sigma factor [Bryobacteraceae bacterium]|nr:sigma-70 family RNA polymerase sigma factor [Bryobacteraceae bacterium]